MHARRATSDGRIPAGFPPRHVHSIWRESFVVRCLILSISLDATLYVIVAITFAAKKRMKYLRKTHKMGAFSPHIPIDQSQRGARKGASPTEGRPTLYARDPRLSGWARPHRNSPDRARPSFAHLQYNRRAFASHGRQLCRAGSPNRRRTRRAEVDCLAGAHVRIVLRIAVAPSRAPTIPSRAGASARCHVGIACFLLTRPCVKLHAGLPGQARAQVDEGEMADGARQARGRPGL